MAERIINSEEDVRDFILKLQHNSWSFSWKRDENGGFMGPHGHIVAYHAYYNTRHPNGQLTARIPIRFHEGITEKLLILKLLGALEHCGRKILEKELKICEISAREVLDEKRT